ncbi:MAG: hypothetical protein ACOC9Q_00815 [bacterium]
MTKPEIDPARLDHLGEIRDREHSATMQLFERYRERLDERNDARTKLADVDRQIAAVPQRRNDPEWQAHREKASAKMEEAERRLAEAERARNEASERFQTAGGLHSKCLEWCKENRIEVAQ